MEQHYHTWLAPMETLVADNNQQRLYTQAGERSEHNVNRMAEAENKMSK